MTKPRIRPYRDGHMAGTYMCHGHRPPYRYKCHGFGLTLAEAYESWATHNVICF